MATLFTRIIAGEIPGRFAYADSLAVVLSTIEPIAPGHMLVVPRVEVASYVEASDDLLGHLMVVAKRIGLAQQLAFPGTRAVMMIAGFEVPHLHLHVLSVVNQRDLSFAKAKPAASSVLSEHCQAVRSALCSLGYGAFVPEAMNCL